MELELKVRYKDTVYLGVDKILPYVGEYGRFQKLLTLLLFIMAVPTAYPVIIMHFCSLNPPWRCARNSSTCVFNGTAASTDNRRCRMNRIDWEFTEQKQYSIVTQFDLYCSDEWLIGLTKSIGFVGWGFGAVPLGWLGDKYGRKAILLPSIMVLLVVGFITPLLPNIYLVVVCRFFSCFFIPGSMLQCFILISEIVGVKDRPMAGMLVMLSLPVAFCLIVLKAYFIREWKLLSIMCSAPYVLVLSFYWFIPRSIHWLHMNKRADDVMDILNRIAECNGKPSNWLPTHIKLAPPVETPIHTSSFLDIFRTRKLAIRTLSQGYIWLVTAMSYYGLYLASDALGGSVYLDFFIMSVTEIPTVFLVIVMCDRFGRKRSTLSSLLLGSVTCLAVAFIPTRGSIGMVRITFGMVGKFMLSITFNCIYLWSVEIYPATIRAKGMGWCQVNARGGSAIAPWLSEGMSSMGVGTLFVVMGIPALVGAAVGLLLPETNSLVCPSNSDHGDKEEGLEVIGAEQTVVT